MPGVYQRSREIVLWLTLYDHKHIACPKLLEQFDRPFAPAMSPGRDHGLYDRPFGFGQIARVASDNGSSVPPRHPMPRPANLIAHAARLLLYTWRRLDPSSSPSVSSYATNILCGLRALNSPSRPDGLNQDTVRRTVQSIGAVSLFMTVFIIIIAETSLA